MFFGKAGTRLTTQYHNPQDHNINLHYNGNLESRTIVLPLLSFYLFRTKARQLR
jgi:hypothetical protein